MENAASINIFITLFTASIKIDQFLMNGNANVPLVCFCCKRSTFGTLYPNNNLKQQPFFYIVIFFVRVDTAKFVSVLIRCAIYVFTNEKKGSYRNGWMGIINYPDS